jgi:hypothetical protein
MKKEFLILAVFIFLGVMVNAQDIRRIKHVGTGFYLNTEGCTLEDGKVQCTPIKEGWLSAQWELRWESNGVFQLQNVYTHGTLINALGKIVCRGVGRTPELSYTDSAGKAHWICDPMPYPPQARWQFNRLGLTSNFIIFNYAAALEKATHHLNFSVKDNAVYCYAVKDAFNDPNAQWVWEPVKK